MLLPVILYTWACAAWAESSTSLTCKPLVGLPLSQPYPPAYFQSIRLPACSQYTCSCCNLTHVLAIHRALSAAREDPAFSRKCLAWQTRMSCRVCDPEVGVGLKPRVCRSACDQWWAACRDEYFTFEAPSLSAFDPQLLPCSAARADAQVSAAAGVAAAAAAGGALAVGPLLCSRLRDVVRDGEGLCREAGYEVSAGADGLVGDESCFDGSATYSTDFCKRAPPAAQRSGARRQAQRRGKGGTEELEPLSPAVYFVAGVVLLGLAWLTFTTRLGARLDGEAGIARPSPVVGRNHPTDASHQADDVAAMQRLHYRQLQRRDD